MLQLVTTALLWFSALGCGLMAGVYFAFSAFIMGALGRIDPSSGVAAMNAINVGILRSLFMPLFLGTTLVAAALVVLALLSWGGPGAPLMLAGGLAYGLGMFVVTMALNVPLNNALAAVEPASAEAASTWPRYLRDWTFWNHVRTAASLAASALFIGALVARS